LVLAGNKAIYGHVGDSRIFMIRKGSIYQLTEDHTFVNELVKRGVVSKEDAKNHPQGNVLSRAVGVQPSVAVDTMVFDVDPGDHLLLCSDGLHNYYPSSDEIIGLISTDKKASLDALINLALDRGGHDNCTGILIEIPGGAADVVPSVAAADRIAILKRIPLFTYLSYGELIKVLGITQLKQIPKETLFVTEGDRGDEFYVLLSGEVNVLKGDQVIAQLNAGVHLGEMALVDNAPRSASIKSISDINVLVMKRKDFFWIIRNEPVVAAKLLWSFVQVLSTRLRETNEALRGAKEKLGGTNAENEEIEILFDEEE
jgi:PPM family protein phosphatase